MSSEQGTMGAAPAIGWAPRKRAAAIGTFCLYVVLAALTLLFLLPFAWLVSTSLKASTQVFDSSLIPHPVMWSNYSNVLQNTNYLAWTRNSFIVTILGMTTVAISSAIVAYPFAKLNFPFKRVLFALVLSTMMMPSAATMVPTFLIWRHLGLVNTLYPLWVGNLFGSAFYIFMLRQFFMTIPNDLKEAATVDGASQIRTLVSVMLPLVKPAIIAVMLFEFVAKWNDYLTPLIYLNRTDLYTLPLGLATFTQSQGFETRWDLWMTGSVLMILPVLILFFLGQRFFIEGIATTGLKG